MLAKLREPISGLTHLGGAVAAFIGQIAMLIIGWDGTAKIVSILIYTSSLIGLFAASAVYHLVKARPKVVEVLRKVDHSAIYLLIAGTYTPICVNAFTGFWKWGLLAIIWTLAAVGILVKVFVIRAPRWLTAGVYVVMGWLCLAAIGEMMARLPVFVLIWLLIGGVIYTLGALVYITRCLDFWPGTFGFHEVWHIFVLLGALAHFIAVMGVIWPLA
ncbi:MAG: hemolysin III family protein [Anaerolineales bacterium]|nr:hemolysin III family protein [Anaerolineales bacterium]